MLTTLPHLGPCCAGISACVLLADSLPQHAQHWGCFIHSEGLWVITVVDKTPAVASSACIKLSYGRWAGLRARHQTERIQKPNWWWVTQISKLIEGSVASFLCLFPLSLCLSLSLSSSWFVYSGRSSVIDSWQPHGKPHMWCIDACCQ